MFKPVSTNINFPDLEKNLLEYWKKENIIEQYLTKNSQATKRFSFIDGPITANNPMGVHHAWGRTYKDLWQKFYNMMGYQGRFQNGFDCQGLWVEVEVEKELKIKNKKDIENLIPGDKKASIARFVELCRERVRKYSRIQTQQSQRLGYFVDWDSSYYTMSDENNYMIWHFLKTCHEKGWIYKGIDSVPWCPRCQTAISQHEMLTEDYKELVHETVFVKLKVTDAGKLKVKTDNLYLLIWTTTPWTVPANVAVAVNTKFKYSLWENKKKNEAIIILESDHNHDQPFRLFQNKQMPLAQYLFHDVEGEYKKIREVNGRELLGLTYLAPFDHLPRVKNARSEKPHKFHTVVDGSEIVVGQEGTGLLHIAPGAGKEDFDLGRKENLAIISLIEDDASYGTGMDEFSGLNAKKHPEIIIDYLKKHRGGEFLLKTLSYQHRYPACWRCKTELVWKVTREWYIAMDVRPLPTQNSKEDSKTLRELMVETAKMIKWLPEFGLDRELDWLSNMDDWLISKKNRYWGLALPIFECDCGSFEVIGSKEELQNRAIEGWPDFTGHSPHKPFIDEIKIACRKCRQTISRIDDVGNVWLDAGIVPFSTLVDPSTGQLSYTTDKKYWKKWFPADFITESFPGQFKNWFYSLIAMSTVLERKNSFRKVLGYASVLGEDGRPMHKSWGNAIDFNEAADKIGVDVMRWMYVSHNPRENLLFGYKKADETRREFHLRLWNIYNFFITYANANSWLPSEKIEVQNLTFLDNWILQRLNQVIKISTSSLLEYDAYQAASAINSFVLDLSVWYVRRIRDRVNVINQDKKDRSSALTTLHTVLVILARILAPFLPFLSEEIYLNLRREKSVHLASWPKPDNKYPQNTLLLDKMRTVRHICELGHAERKNKNIKVRQPLASLTVTNAPYELEDGLINLIQEELNVKKVVLQTGKKELQVILDTRLSEELIEEGKARELIRNIQNKRKELGCQPKDEVEIYLTDWPALFTDLIKRRTGAKSISKATEFKVVKA